jgi:hypothetical protein
VRAGLQLADRAGIAGAGCSHGNSQNNTAPRAPPSPLVQRPIIWCRLIVVCSGCLAVWLR